MTVFKPEVDGQKAGAVKAFLMAENADDLREKNYGADISTLIRMIENGEL